MSVAAVNSHKSDLLWGDGTNRNRYAYKEPKIATCVGNYNPSRRHKTYKFYGREVMLVLHTFNNGCVKIRIMRTWIIILDANHGVTTMDMIG